MYCIVYVSCFISEILIKGIVRTYVENSERKIK